MKKQLCMLLSLVLALTAIFAVIPAQAENEKVVNVGWEYEPETLDPAKSEADCSYELIRMTGEGLLRNVGNEAVPGIAESYEVNDDSTEYVFHLRKSAYADGTPVTAQDFEYSFKRLLDPTLANNNAATGYFLKNGEAYVNGECTADDVGVKAIDEYTLRVTTQYPDFPLTFTDRSLFPVNKEKAESMGITYGAEADTTLSNGPFTVTEWVHDSVVTLEKNPNYWNADAVKLDKIVLKINVSADAAVDMMLAGEVDVCKAGSVQRKDTLMDTGEYYTLVQQGGWQNMQLNQAGKTPESGLFLSNVNFRKALCFAIDREALGATVYTVDEPATRVIYPLEKGVEDTFQAEFPYEGWSSKADPEKAQEYLQTALTELGKTIDDVPTFSLLCFDSNGAMLSLNAVMDMWHKTLGINCEIDAQPIQNMIQKAYSGDFDFWKGGNGAVLTDSLGFFESYLSGKPIYNMNDPVFDELYHNAQYAGTWAERKQCIFELEKYFCDNVENMILMWSDTTYVIRNNITNVNMDSVSADLTFADIAE